jgi:acetyl-CoA acetyltransferase
MSRPPFPRAAIAGAFNTRQARRLEGHSSLSISLEAARGAIDLTGLPLDDVDGVFGSICGEIVYHLGLGPCATSGLENVGIPAVVEAASAVEAGICEVALVVSGGAGTYTDRASTAPWTRPANEWVLPFGMYTAVEFALVAQRHMYLYGTKPEHLALVAATIRNNGHANPEAAYFGRGPFTVDDVLSSPIIADPFHRLDCAMTSEGACALVVTTVERARDSNLAPVRIIGVGRDRLGPVYQHPPAWDLAAARHPTPNNGSVGQAAAARAFAQAGLQPDDVDLCEFYDPFSFEIIRQFEAFGFCGPGEGGDFVADGHMAPDGRYPTATDGGLMSFSHAGRAQTLQRVGRGVQQLQGVCVSNQVADPNVALCSNGGAGALYSDVILLGTDDA